MGGKIINIIKWLLAITLTVTSARAIDSVDLIQSKEEVILGSRIDFAYLVDSSSLELSLIRPDGNKDELRFDHGDDSGYLELSYIPEILGDYRSEGLTIDGNYYEFTDLNFSVKETSQEVFGTANSIIIEDHMPDTLESKDLIEALSKVKFYDSLGDGLVVDIRLTDGENDYSFETLDDGFSSMTTVFDEKVLDPGTYTCLFTSGSETYEKEIEIIPSTGQSQAAAAKLSSLTRLAGSNRYETAVEVSKNIYDSSSWAVLTNGNSYLDTLTSIPLASALDGPSLFSGRDRLDPATRAELERLGVKNVYLVGGTSAIRPQIESDLRDMGIISTRISGKDAVDTAINVAAELNKYVSFDRAIVADASNFADALASSPLAAKENIPILFVENSKIDQDSLKRVRALGIGSITVVGGPSSISNESTRILENNGVGVERIYGANRYETALNFADKYFKDAKNLVIASGQTWPDAVIGGLLASDYESALILTQKDSNPQGLKDQVAKLAGGNIFVLGGENTINSSVYREIDSFIVQAQPQEAPKPVPPVTQTPEQTQTKPSTQVNPGYQAWIDRTERLEASREPGPIRIFLDQGHGWNYNKGVVEGYYEGNAMYWYGLILRNELREYGFVVDTIRNDLDAERAYCISMGFTNTNGEMVSLRGPKAAGYDLLVSLHTNAHSDPKVSGTEVFDSAQSPTYELAANISRVTAEHFGHNNRGVKYRFNDPAGTVKYGSIADTERGVDWYGVLRTSAAPRAMMLEQGFHSNWSDCSKLMDKEFKHEMARKTAQEIAAYYGYSK